MGRIDIKPLPNKINELLPKDNTPDFLPKQFMFFIIYGQRQTGKTVLISNLIERYGLKNVYETIYVFSPTAKHDLSWAPIRELKNLIIVDGDNLTPPMVEFIRQQQELKWDRYINFLTNKKKKERKNSRYDLYNESEEENEFKKVPNCLMIFDDCSEQYNKYEKVLSTLASRGRHAGTSVILTSHIVRCLPVMCRNNATSFIAFRLRETERQKFIEEQSDLLSKKDLEKILDVATNDRYSFLYFNGDKNKFSIKFDDY